LQASSRATDAGNAEVLAGEASAEHVALGEGGGVGGGNVAPPNNTRPRSLERGLAEGVRFDLVDGASDARPFEAKLKPANPGETRANSVSESIHAIPS
jgi:hypothetical protein